MSTAKIKDLEQCCEVFKEWIQIEEKMIAIILKKQKELSDQVAQWNDYLIDQQQSSKHRQQMIDDSPSLRFGSGVSAGMPNPFGAGGKFDMGDVRGSAIAQRRRGGTRKKSHRRKKNIRKTRRRRNNK